MLEVRRNNFWSEVMPYTQRKFILSKKIYFVGPKKVQPINFHVRFYMIPQVKAMFGYSYYVNLEAKISSEHMQWCRCFQIQKIVNVHASCSLI